MADEEKKGWVEAGYTLDRDESGLTSNERQVLEGFKAGKTGSKIATELGLSRQRVSTIRKRLIEKGALAVSAK